MNTRLQILIFCFATYTNSMVQLPSPKKLTPSLLDAQGNINLRRIDLHTLKNPLYAITRAHKALTTEIKKRTRQEKKHLEKSRQVTLEEQQATRKQTMTAILEELLYERKQQINRKKQEEELRQEMLKEHLKNQELCVSLAKKPSNIITHVLDLDTCNIDTNSTTDVSAYTTSPIINDAGDIDYHNIDLTSITTPIPSITKAHQAIVEEIKKRKSPETHKTLA